MGKANRNKQADQEARRLSMDRKKQAQADARKKEQRSKAITILCTVLVAALLLGVLAYNWMLTSGFFMRQNIAASTENYKLDQTHASYYYNSIYSQYSSMAPGPTPMA